MTKESKFAVFHYQNDDKKIIDEVASYLDCHAQRIFDFFEVNAPDEKVSIRIIPTKQEFDKIYKETWNHDAADWSIGFYYFKDRQITYLSLNDYKSTSHAFEKEDFPKALEYYKKTIVHEFVHFVNDLFKVKHDCGYTEKYLSEGLATYLSGQKEGQNLVFDYTLDEIYKNRGCYNGWYILTKHLIENYDREFVFSLIKSNRKAREFLEKELFDKVKNLYMPKSLD